MQTDFVKNKTIKKLIIDLKISFGDEIQFVDYWDADLCSIGISSRKKDGILIYVQTFSLPIGKFYIDVDKKDSDSEIGFTTVETHNEIDYKTLSTLVVKYLALQN